MPRGFLVSEYVDDDGTPWRLNVDADYGTMVDRGWVTGLTPGLPPFPREWSPRIVVGVDPTGRKQRARVATLDAPLWTGSSPSFTFRASDGAFYEAVVIQRIGEKRRL
jgi:hypothetical protein